MSTAMLALAALVALCVGFAAVYALARRIDNYGVVDIAWSWAFGLLAVFYAVFASGWPARRALLAALVLAWSARLGAHLLRRVASHHPVEDGRYVALRRDWSANFAPKMFGFFQMQALSVLLLGLPFLLAAIHDTPGFHPLEIAGALIVLIAVAGEAIADRQLAAFKRAKPGSGGVCDRGLWRYSRHPNYFFEWLVWIGFGCFAVTTPWGCLGFIPAAVILWLLLRVTGIPATEEQALRTKGEAYRRYQQTTSVFIPLPRRQERAASSG